VSETVDVGFTLSRLNRSSACLYVYCVHAGQCRWRFHCPVVWCCQIAEMLRHRRRQNVGKTDLSKKSRV